ncbi:uncharacterized protein LOC127732944 isoform X2 [Mytilus californianus]|uniref:uncharacterized protein LOC127732944 isoform X2 n=1 Tax=Mytilus californianus TaxID=6549 RepID=UPI002247290E|nr:uncharacterized protein LOC127732944 isoform X2 [Mytilus californianus]
MMYPWQEQCLQQFQNENRPQTRVSPSDPRTRVNPQVFSSSVPGDVRMRNPMMMHNLLQEMRNMYQSGMVGSTSIAQHGLQNRAPPPLYNSMTRTNTAPQLRGPPPLLNVSTLRQPPPAHSNKRQPPPAHSNQPSYMVHHNINQIRPNIPLRHTSGETIRLTNPFENEINVPCTRTSPHLSPDMFISQAGNISTQMSAQSINSTLPSNVNSNNVSQRLVSQQSNLDPRLFHSSLYHHHLFPPLGYIPPNLPENSLVPNMMPRMPPQNPYTEFNIPRPQFMSNQDPPFINQTEPTEASDKSVMGRWYKLPITDLVSEKKDLIEEEKERIHRPSKPISHSSLENVVNKLVKRHETVSPISSVASQFPVSREDAIYGPLTGNVLLPPSPKEQHKGQSVDTISHEGQSVDTISHEGQSVDTIRPEGQLVDTIRPEGQSVDTLKCQDICSDVIASENSKTEEGTDSHPIQKNKEEIFDDIGLYIVNTYSLASNDVSSKTENNLENTQSAEQNQPTQKRIPPLKIKLPFRKSPKKKRFGNSRKSKFVSPIKLVLNKNGKKQIEIRKPKAFMFDQSNSSESIASSSTTNAIDENVGNNSISSTLNPSDSGKSLGDVVEKVKQKRQRRRSAVLIDQMGKVLSSEENVQVKTTEKTETVIENNKQDKEESENAENVISGSENIDVPMLSSSENIVSSEQIAPPLKEPKKSDSLSREERNRELIEKNWVHIEAKLKLVEKNLKNKSPQKKQPLPLESKTVEKTPSLKRKSVEMKPDNSNNEPVSKKKSPLKEKLFKSPSKKIKSPRSTKSPNKNAKQDKVTQSSLTCSRESSKSEEGSSTPKSGRGKKGGKSKKESPKKDNNISVDISGNPSKRRKLSGTVDKRLSDSKLSPTSASLQSSSSVEEKLSSGDVIVVGEDRISGIPNEQTQDITELISSITYPSFFITFHGKRVLCLNSSSGKLLLMREILRRNFKDVVNKNSQHDTDMQKQFKTVYLAKERDLKICYNEIPEEHKNLAVKYLKAEKLLKTQKMPAHLGVITLENALRLYHYMNGTKTCSMNCLEMWSPKESNNIPGNSDEGSVDPLSVPNNTNKSKEFKSRGRKNNSGYDSDETIIYEDQSGPPSQNQNTDEENNDSSRLVLRGGVAECYQAYFRYIVVEGEKFYPYEDLLLKFGKIALTRALQSKLPEKFLAYKCSEVEADFLNKLEDLLPTLSIEATLLEESLFQKVASTVESSNIHGEVVDLTVDDMANESRMDNDDINLSQDDSIIEISFNSPQSPPQCEETKHIICNEIAENNVEPTSVDTPTEIPQLYQSPPTEDTCLQSTDIKLNQTEKAVCDSTTDGSHTIEENNNDGNSSSVIIGNNDLAAMLAELESEFGSSSDNGIATDISAGSALQFMTESFSNSRNMIETLLNIWKHAKLSALQAEMNDLKTGTNKVLSTCEKYQGLINKIKENIEGKKEN